MPSDSLSSLLEPSLQHGRASEPIYSVRAGFMVAFFGGLYATLIFSFLNSRKLGRAREDLWLYVTLAALGTALVVWLGYAAISGELPSWLSFTDNRGRDSRYVVRAVALLMFGACYLRLRRFYTASQLAGQAPPNPWKPGLAACAVSVLLTLGAGALGAMMAGPP
jgi:hypothetical protein